MRWCGICNENNFLASKQHCYDCLEGVLVTSPSIVLLGLINARRLIVVRLKSFISQSRSQILEGRVGSGGFGQFREQSLHKLNDFCWLYTGLYYSI